MNQASLSEVQQCSQSSSSPTILPGDGVGSTFNAGAEPFVPADSLSHGRGIDDVLRDHSEVEKVLQGGVGTATTDTAAWHNSSQSGSPLPTITVRSNSSEQLLSLPFANGEIQTSFLTPAKPVIKTSSLKEV